MRRLVKNQILEILSTIGEELTKPQMVNSLNSSIEQIITDCNEGINAINRVFEMNFFEDIYTQYFNLTRELQRYLGIFFESMDMQPKKKLIKKIHKVINEIKSKLNNETQITIEVAFLPYKASMWDCMDSIWRAAEKDPLCKPYVVPIPYFEKDNDGNFKKMCYEGSLFPDDVPVIHYLNYSIVDHLPDIIYIHNIFDENNFVTSVASDYYTCKLKQYTDMLVYVPYFITEGAMPHNMASFRSINFIDKIIVQGKQAKEELIDKIPYEKIVALGSPKVDRLHSIIQPTVPKEWMYKRKNKMVFMYNCSITGLLKNTQEMLQKIRSVLSIFENAPNALVLWRPHPLLETTIESMRPQYYLEYLALKEWFLKSDFGIFDETVDVDTSVAFSDIYIGERSSSVVTLFGVCGKPRILLQPFVIQQESENKQLFVPLRTTDCCKDEDTIWFMASYYSVLCSFNLIKGSIEFKKVIPEYIKKKFCFTSIAKCANNIVIAPYFASDIFIYHTDSDNFEKFELQDRSYEPCFDKTISYNQYVYLKPRCYPAIVRYDTITKEIKYIYDCIVPFLSSNRHNNDALFMLAAETVGSLLYIGSATDNRILEFNMETEMYKIYTLDINTKGFFGMAYDGKYFWLTPMAGTEIVRWSPNSSIQIYNDFPKKFQHKNLRAFRNIIYYHERLLLFPEGSNLVLQIDTTTGSIKEFPFDFSKSDSKADILQGIISETFDFAKLLEDGMVVASRAYDNSLYTLDLNTDIRQRFDLAASLPNTYPKAKLYTEQVNTIYESEYFSIQDIIQSLLLRTDLKREEEKRKSIESYGDRIMNMDGTCGEKIYNYIKNELKDCIYDNR